MSGQWQFLVFMVREKLWEQLDYNGARSLLSHLSFVSRQTTDR